MGEGEGLAPPGAALGVALALALLPGTLPPGASRRMLVRVERKGRLSTTQLPRAGSSPAYFCTAMPLQPDCCSLMEK